MIVRNERNLLPDCLASVAALEPLLSEYIFVDTGSKDGTLEYLKQEYPLATVLEIPWPDHYAQARNQSLRLAHGEWVLVLDADERLCSESVAVFKDLFNPDRLGDLDAIEVLRENEDQRGKIVSWDYLCRLFRRWPQFPQEPELCYFGRIHERLAWSQNGPSERGLRKVTLSSIRIRHLADSETLAQAKELYYLDLLNQARQQEPCPYMDFHWACLPTVMRSVPAYERLTVLQQALQDSLRPPLTTLPGWRAAPLAAMVLEIQMLMVELGQTQAMIMWFEQVLSELQGLNLQGPELHAESWGHYALACREHRLQNKAYQGFLQSLDPLYPEADPSLGWGSWRARAFLSEILSGQDPIAAGLTALQGLLSGPDERFASSLRQSLRTAQNVSHVPAPEMLAVLKQSATRAFQAQDYQATLQLQAFLLPLLADQKSFLDCIKSAYFLKNFDLVDLLRQITLLLWPEIQHRVLPFQTRRGSAVTATQRVLSECFCLWQAFTPLMFPDEAYLFWPVGQDPPQALSARAAQCFSVKNYLEQGPLSDWAPSFRGQGIYDGHLLEQIKKYLPDKRRGWLLDARESETIPDKVFQRLLAIMSWPGGRCDVFVFKGQGFDLRLWPMALLAHVPGVSIPQIFYHQVDLERVYDNLNPLQTPSAMRHNK